MRTFAWFLVGFVVLVLVFVAAFAVQGQGVRTYALRVAGDAQGVGACAKVAPDVKAPANLTRCEVRREAGRVVVQVTLEDGRAYLVLR